MKSKSLFCTNLAFLILMIAFSSSSYSQSIEGYWYGKANIQGIELRLSIHVKTTDQGYTSTFDSPDQGAFAIQSTTTTFKSPDFSFSHSEAGFKYTGQVNASYTEISGNMIQGNLNVPITFGRTSVAPAPSSPETLKQKYDKQEVYITMRDGVKLFTSIYTPKNNSFTHPVLLNRTPIKKFN